MQSLKNKFGSRLGPRPVDTRSWHQRINDIKDKHVPISKDYRELAELRNLIESTHVIDDLFQERDIELLFN